MSDLTVNDLAWLRGELGPEPADADLQARYARLGDKTAVALEVLRERRGRMIAAPLRVKVQGVADVDNTANLPALDSAIGRLEEGLTVAEASLPPLTRTRLRRDWSR